MSEGERTLPEAGSTTADRGDPIDPGIQTPNEPGGRDAPGRRREPLAAATRSYARAFGPRLRCDESLVGVDVYWLFIAPSFRGRP